MESEPSSHPRFRIYDGESYDARLEQNGWDQPSSLTGAGAVRGPRPGPRPRWFAQDFQPFGRMRRFESKTVTIQSRALYIFDPARLWSLARLHVAGKAGPKSNPVWGSPKAECENSTPRICVRLRPPMSYILRGKGTESFEPHFTFHGFRYVELTATQNAFAGRS